MKKLILVGCLAFGALGFSRFVNECQVTSKAKGRATCESLESGKTFQFTSGKLSSISKGSTYKVYFEGNGYKGLRVTKATLVSSEDDSSDYDDSEGDY